MLPRESTAGAPVTPPDMRAYHKLCPDDEFNAYKPLRAPKYTAVSSRDRAGDEGIGPFKLMRQFCVPEMTLMEYACVSSEPKYALYSESTAGALYTGPALLKTHAFSFSEGAGGAMARQPHVQHDISRPPRRRPSDSGMQTQRT